MIDLWSLWTYQGKLYRVTGFARGAGSMKGQDVILYEPCYECEHPSFARPVDEFKEKFSAHTEAK